MTSTLTLVIYFVFLIGFNFGEAEKINYGSDGSTVLDSEITFFISVLNPSRDDYDVTWTENIPDGRKISEKLNKTNNHQSNWTLSYPESDYWPGIYSVTTSVGYMRFGLIWINIGTYIINYEISNNFTGQLVLSQANETQKRDPTFVSTLKQTEISLIVNNTNHHFIENAKNVTYSWYNETSFITNTTVPTLFQNFTKEGNYMINATLEVIYERMFNQTTNQTKVKYGNFATTVKAKIPIIKFGIDGITWFPHGKLLDLKVSCNGTPPFSYCWKITPGTYNRTGNETCSHPSVVVTNDCQFPIMWYLNDPGIYSLLIVLDNDLSHLINQTTINVYKTTKKQQLSIIVIPLSATIVAIILIIFGVAYYWENQARFTVEVADFDFETDKELPYMTFYERIRDALQSLRWDNNTRRDDGTSIDRNVLVNGLEESPTFTQYGVFHS